MKHIQFWSGPILLGATMAAAFFVLLVYVVWPGCLVPEDKPVEWARRVGVSDPKVVNSWTLLSHRICGVDYDAAFEVSSKSNPTQTVLVCCNVVGPCRARGTF